MKAFGNWACREGYPVDPAFMRVRAPKVAQKEMGQANSTLEGTRRLFQKGFVTKIEQERDDIAYENARLKVQTAETAHQLTAGDVTARAPTNGPREVAEVGSSAAEEGEDREDAAVVVWRVAEAEFVQDGADVRFDGAGAEDEAFADAGVGASFGH